MKIGDLVYDLFVIGLYAQDERRSERSRKWKIIKIAPYFNAGSTFKLNIVSNN